MKTKNKIISMVLALVLDAISIEHLNSACSKCGRNTF